MHIGSIFQYFWRIQTEISVPLCDTVHSFSIPRLARHTIKRHMKQVYSVRICTNCGIWFFCGVTFLTRNYESDLKPHSFTSWIYTLLPVTVILIQSILFPCECDITKVRIIYKINLLDVTTDLNTVDYCVFVSL